MKKACGNKPKKFIKKYKREFIQKSSQLQIGAKIEAEHTRTIKQIQEDAKAGKLKPLSEYTKMIAKDHLKEISDYYTRLIEMESKAKRELSKSYDFRDVFVSVDPVKQQAAEVTTCPKLLQFLKEQIGNENTTPVGQVYKVTMDKGILTVNPMAPGLYNGFFQDHQGQIVEKFDDQTLELIAKNLELKGWYVRPIEPTKEEVKPEESNNIVIKVGDVELEIRKSIHDFVKSFKAAKNLDRSMVKKSISAWRRNMSNTVKYKTDVDAAEELFRNWDQHKESFYQIIYAMKKIKDE